MPADFAPVYAELRALMLRAATGMIVSKDGPEAVELLAPFAHPLKPKAPMWFGAVRRGKAYVSFHLMPLYVSPALLAQVTPGLKARMHGKSCFNIREPDPELLTELATLTRACAQAFSRPPSS